MVQGKTIAKHSGEYQCFKGLDPSSRGDTSSVSNSLSE
jgi:hypothetical protein